MTLVCIVTGYKLKVVYTRKSSLEVAPTTLVQKVDNKVFKLCVVYTFSAALS